MAAFQLLFLLMVSCVVASARPSRQIPPCHIVQMDVICRDLSLRSAPDNLPRGVQMLDLSLNQVQNLSQRTLAYHTSFHRLNLQSNRIHFIQPGLFQNMSDLKVLDLSKNHLSVFGFSKINVGPLTAVESLDLSSNGLYTGMSDYFLADSPLLTNLSLNSNSITKIGQHTFKGSLSLKKISLHNNVILEIEDGAFDSLKNLTELDLSKNSITCIRDFNLHRLKVFNLSQNSMELFCSVDSRAAYELQTLDLSKNKMLYFPSLPQNNVLRYLDVSRNLLGNLSKGLDTPLNDLMYLDLSYNRLTNVSESFFTLMGSLEVLNVSNNCIGSFSVTTGAVLRSVRTVHLGYNSLRSLTVGADALPSLERLYLQGNDLATLDHGVFQRLPKLRQLQLQGNGLKICASERNRRTGDGCVSFSYIPNLQFLDISENNLPTLPADAFAETPLRLLDVSRNPGLDMDQDALSGLDRSLVHLLVRENNISRLDTHLSALRSLKHVDLSGNQLTSLPQWNKESSIESLNLQSNNLVTLEDGNMLGLKRSLKTLYMGSNPLSCCRNLGFVHMVQSSALDVPDLPSVTCVYDDASAPVNIGAVSAEACRAANTSSYIIAAVLALIGLAALLALLVKCCRSRKRKHSRGYRA
ncbi:transforming growth factor beta activator LRRC32 [Betta splendens]|uniref:Transforming growth factor beta activator LRRC32 n=1 Tax=Betta splendens TaxID=158456 RepID=A0A6P7PEZ2_BETSP|nr:transforming growth factor beta activator LRRC32 [Betta splendens]XP_055358140.1 transforming growth factor beta activator LRRC32 [Betta splendens]